MSIILTLVFNAGRVDHPRSYFFQLFVRFIGKLRQLFMPLSTQRLALLSDRFGLWAVAGYKLLPHPFKSPPSQPFNSHSCARSATKTFLRKFQVCCEPPLVANVLLSG